MISKEDILNSINQLEAIKEKIAYREFQKQCAFKSALYGILKTKYNFNLQNEYQIVNIVFYPEIINVQLKIKIYDNEEILYHKTYTYFPWADLLMSDEEYNKELEIIHTTVANRIC